MTPRDLREATDTSFANALLDSAMNDGPAPDALGRELARLGLGTVAGVAAVTSLAGSAAPTAAAASKLTAASIFSAATAMKIGVVAAIAVAATSYVALRAPMPSASPPSASPPSASAVTGAAAVARDERPTTTAPPAIAPRAPEVTAAASAPGIARPAAPNAAVTASTASASTPPRGPEDVRALAAEVSLVDRARSLAHGSPDAALALLDEYARTFPGGALRDEAAVVRVEALLAAGRRADAERVARPFLQERAGTPLARRLSDLLGTIP